MRAFQKMAGLVLSILFAAALAQLLFNYALASTGNVEPSPDADDGGSIAVFPGSPPADAPASPAPATEYVYGTAQSASFTISNPGNSIDLAFNDATASASGQWGKATTNNWTFTAIEDTTLTPTGVTAEYRFYQSGWSNDSFAVEVYDGTAWTTLDTFSSGNPPPTSLTTASYNATAVLNTQAKINDAQMRFRGTGKTGSADSFTIYVDEVRLDVTGEPTPGAAKQAHYRIGRDQALANGDNETYYYAAVDTAATDIPYNANFRIRFQVYNDGGQVKSWQPQLEWSATSGSGYAAVPTTSGADPFFVTDTSQFTNGDTISTADFGCGSGTGTAESGKAYDTENPPGSAISLTNGYYTEIEFNIQANSNAAYNTSYYFRLTDNGVALDAYDVTEAVITMQSGAQLKQAHYRIGNDEPLSSMTWKGGVDQRAINIRRDTDFRIRFQVYNDGGQVKSWQPQLEWSATSGSGYAAVPTTSGGNPFFVTGTTQFANGDTISTADFGCGSGNGTAQNGAAYDTENPPASAISLTNGYYAEIEFNVQANNYASYGGSYYFRLTDSGTAFDAYDVTEAEIYIQPQPSASDPHNTYATDTDKCGGCHRAHASSGQRLRNGSTEEAVCFSCHDGTGAATDINSQFSKTYNHPVASQAWIHQPDESAASSFSSSNRHVECEDCHKPHSRWPGTHDLGSNAISLVIDTASGLSVSNGAAWTTPTFTFDSSPAYEYELCFKCHTSWSGATTRTYPSYSGEGFTLTDQSVEFNPANYAHHAVEAPGNNQSTNSNYLQTFVSPITPSSTIYCSDCHGSETTTDPSGPHGSTNKSLKAGSTDDSAIVCYKCHRYDVYGLPGDTTAPNSSLSRFPHPAAKQHTYNTDNVWGIFCLNCHGGATAGGIHGTHAAAGPQANSEPLGEHFMNGASMTSFEEGTGGVADSAACWTKGSADSVNSCTQGHSNKQFTPNYDY